MTVEEIAFRALLYRELHDQRYTDVDDLVEHHAEMERELPPGAAAVFAHTLPPEDWAVVRAMDRLMRDSEHGATVIELLYIYDPARLEAMCHALEIQPQVAPGVAADILARWDRVRAAMRSFGFWSMRADDLPTDWREQPGGEQLADDLRELLNEWPPPEQDPALSARQFELALARALAKVSNGH